MTTHWRDRLALRLANICLRLASSSTYRVVATARVSDFTFVPGKPTVAVGNMTLLKWTTS